ncbi:MAG: hypothetical protein JWO63_2837 [Frankiales bacterium]|nr:hypothetical protein [Frankiales bacterium]
MVSSPGAPASAGDGVTEANHHGIAGPDRNGAGPDRNGTERNGAGPVRNGADRNGADRNGTGRNGAGPDRNGAGSWLREPLDGQPMHLQLIRPLGKTTWCARVDGAEVAARPLPCAIDDERTAELPRVLTQPGPDQLIQFLGVGMVERGPWMLSQYVPGAALERLLTAAALTPYQAATIAVDIFVGLAALHRAGLAHGRLTTNTVRVGKDGISRLADWAVAALVPPRPAASGTDVDAGRSARDRDLAAAAAIVDELARNADRPVSRRDSVDGGILTCLARIGATGVIDAEDAQAVLRRAMHHASDGGPPRPNAHTELAVLVQAAASRLPENASTAPAAPAIDAAWSASTKLSNANWQVRRRRTRVWVSVAVLAAALVAAVVVIRPGQADLDRLLHRHSGASTNKAAATVRGAVVKPGGKPHAVPKVAPSAVGIVSSVSAGAVGACVAGHACRLSIGLRITPSAAAQHIGWEVRIYNRCTGVFTTRAGTTLAAAPGATSVHTTAAVAVPAGRALALIVTTTRPARAAAAPVLVPATTRTC